MAVDTRTIGTVVFAARLLGVGALALALSGCVGSLFGGGSSDKSLATSNASETEIVAGAPNALPAIATQCPPIKIRNGGEALFAYASNDIGNAKSLRYQAVIERQSRNCVVSNGLITVKMGVIGRLMLGPAGTESSVELPLRFAVERDEIAVFSQVYNIPVAITPPNQSEEFVKVVENVAIPYIGGENIVIWVGFDPNA